jgi:DNA-binding response OmpR family regulator
MRSLTNIPILIATDSFTTQKEVAALENGADLYTPWHEKPEDNMASVMAHVTQLSERSKMPRPSTKVMVYKGLLIAPIYRTVFVDNKRIDLTRQEYDLLYYLMMNHGKVLSYNEIFNSVWGSDYDGSERKVLRNAVKRLREKLKVDSKNIGHIKTVLDYGYTFPFESDK